MNYVDEVLSVTGKVRFYGTRFTYTANDMQLIPIGKISSNRDSIRKARKAGLASRNTVHVQKNILRCVGFCLYILHFICEADLRSLLIQRIRAGSSFRLLAFKTFYERQSVTNMSGQSKTVFVILMN